MYTIQVLGTQYTISHNTNRTKPNKYKMNTTSKALNFVGKLVLKKQPNRG